MIGGSPEAMPVVRLRRQPAVALVAGLALALSACGGDGGAPDGDVDSGAPAKDRRGLNIAALWGGGQPAPLELQATHPNGVVLQVTSIQAKPTQTVVGIRVANGRERETQLNLYGRDSRGYLITDAGEKLPLLLPEGNPTLAVMGGRTADGELVFAGQLPRGESVTLVLNDSPGLDGANSSHGKFQLSLPLDDAFSDDRATLATSRLSGMRANAASTLRAATASSSSTFGAGGAGSSRLRTVEALRSELGAVETERGTVVSLEGDVTFEFDKASVRGAARGTLDQLVELIQGGPEGMISIEGHTDAKGDDAYNQRLSEARANAVRDYFTAAGIATSRLRTIGLGELRPVAPNINADGSDDEAGRQRNRRVEVILPKGVAPAQAEAGASASGSTLSPTGGGMR